ncbi:hypothetical protein B7453_15010 [Pseudomonas sp. IB20]|nr:hypothetical protein B7453_15010 [Pseudomonas sp. IB20]
MSILIRTSLTQKLAASQGLGTQVAPDSLETLSMAMPTNPQVWINIKRRNNKSGKFKKMLKLEINYLLSRRQVK